ncbi:MAG: DAK2 domain-containing protein [Clostridia bacterium]|nr:DAK2 domain-containing protein [Clostridia bacterium]
MAITKTKEPESGAKIFKGKGPKALDGLLFAKMAHGGAAQLRAHADEVNKLNVFPVPDGDTGDNMRMTIESGTAAIKDLENENIGEVARVLSRGMLLGARGNSGVILSQFFAGIAKGLASADSADAVLLGSAFEAGVKQAYTSVMTPTEGTILTVMREAVESAVKQITQKSTPRSFFADIVKEMRASLERTPDILPVLKEAGVVDSGGAGIYYIMDGFNRVLCGEKIEDTGAPLVAAKAPVDTTGFGPDSVMTYGYCTELLVQLQNSKTDIDAFDIESLKAFLGGIGDSIVAFKVDSIVKLHVHTLTPEKVLEYCRKFGEFLTVKIENMSVQHTALEEKEGMEAPAPTPTKQYGIVAVVNGPGVEALFRELGTDAIVQGGQTQNPSTNDFLEAFRNVPAEHIFVFPNNGNILMAARQAAELYEHATVHVLPSKNIGTGYVAISSVDFGNPDPDAIVSEMESAMQRVTAGYVSPAIRDTDMNGVHVTNGDTIGIIDKEIVLSDADKDAAAYGLAAKLLDMPDKFMLTIFAGKDTTPEEQAALQAKLAENYPSAEVYFVDGGQDIYPYIFVAE